MALPFGLLGLSGIGYPGFPSAGTGSIISRREMGPIVIQTPGPVVDESIPRANANEVRLGAQATTVGATVRLSFSALPSNSVHIPPPPAQEQQAAPVQQQAEVISVYWNQDQHGQAPAPAPAPEPAQVQQEYQYVVPEPQVQQQQQQQYIPYQETPQQVHATQSQVQASQARAQSVARPAPQQQPVFGPAISIGIDANGGPVLNLTVGGVTIPISLTPAQAPAPAPVAQSVHQPPPLPPTGFAPVQSSIHDQYSAPLSSAQKQAQQVANEAAVAAQHAEDLRQAELRAQQHADARIQELHLQLQAQEAAAAQARHEAQQAREAQVRAEKEAVLNKSAAQAAALQNRPAPYIPYNPNGTQLANGIQFTTAPISELSLPLTVRAAAGAQVGQAAHFYFQAGALGQAQHQQQQQVTQQQ